MKLRTQGHAQYNLERQCVPILPLEGPYRGLQMALHTRPDTSNKIIADMSKCPLQLTLQEHIAFGLLRTGPHLQWLNISRILQEYTITFHANETHTLICQAIWQVGPVNNGLSWHQDLLEVSFCKLLLQQLDRLLVGVELNWQSDKTVASIVVTVDRLLIATVQPTAIIQESLRILRKARCITYKWIYLLQDRLRETGDPDHISIFQARICAVAAICRSTFALSSLYIPLAFETSDDYATFYECGVFQFDNTSPTQISADLRQLLDRDRRFSLMFHDPQKDYICQRFQDGLHEAILRIWPGYRRGIAWSPITPSAGRWVETRTARAFNQCTQTVKINLLDGNLLVDDKPVGRLDRFISDHVDYIRLFGKVRIFSHTYSRNVI